MHSWASRSWTPESLKAQFGHLNVPVELSLWNDEDGRWGDYRDLYKEQTTPAGSKEFFLPHQPSKTLSLSRQHATQQTHLL